VPVAIVPKKRPRDIALIRIKGISLHQRWALQASKFLEKTVPGQSTP
jgi:hypothetical protein